MKRGDAADEDAADPNFQYLKGAIEARADFIDLKLIDTFNTSKVQLKRARGSKRGWSRGFQYLKGAIEAKSGAPPRKETTTFNTSKVQLKL